MNKKVFVENENKWVATDRAYRKVLAVARNLADLQKKLKKLNIQNAVTMFVPPINKILAPKCQ